ncbi:MAG: LysR family transcriptional regulator [Neisseriaceae bacterium]|nr:LysR family transcriptional regulator [Neisseriaceae bacterium]
MKTRHHLADALSWNLLHTFLVIVEEKSLTKASLRLHVTQSALSQSLKRLEERVGCVLIHRNHRQFELTRQGAELFKIAQEMYQKIASFDDDLQDDTGIKGTIRLLALSRIQNQQYDDFLTAFNRKYPEVGFDIEVLPSSEIWRQLAQKVPAIGIAIYKHKDEKIHDELVINQRYALFCGVNHPLFTVDKITPKMLQKQNFVSFQSEQMGDSLSALTVFRDRLGLMNRTKARSNSLDEVMRLIINGVGIGFLPEHIADDPHLNHKLKKLPPFEGACDIPIHMMWHKERKLSEAEQCFIKAFRQRVQQY